MDGVGSPDWAEIGRWLGGGAARCRTRQGCWARLGLGPLGLGGSRGRAVIERRAADRIGGGQRQLVAQLLSAEVQPRQALPQASQKHPLASAPCPSPSGSSGSGLGAVLLLLLLDLPGTLQVHPGDAIAQPPCGLDQLLA